MILEIKINLILFVTEIQSVFMDTKDKHFFIYELEAN